MVPSGMVRSAIKDNPSVQGCGEVGDAKEMMVGMSVGWAVASFGGGGTAVTGFAGGIYGVGVGTGEQA